MIINMKQYLLTITILWLTTRVSGRGHVPLRLSVRTTTSVGGPLPPTSLFASPAPAPAPAPAPCPAPATSPAPSLAKPSSPPHRSNPSPAKSSPTPSSRATPSLPPPSTTKSSPKPPTTATSSRPPPSPATSPRPPPSPATSSHPPPSRVTSSCPPLSPAKSSPAPPTQASSSRPQNPPHPPTPPTQQRVPKVAPVNPRLRYFCKSTDYPDLCMSSLCPFVVQGHTDPIGILEAGIKATSRHAELTIPALARLKTTPSWSDQTGAAALDNCKDNYADALENLKSATTAVTGPTHDVWTANSMLSAVVSDSEACEDGFQGVGESPVTAYNDKLRMMASNCLAIASLVK